MGKDLPRVTQLVKVVGVDPRAAWTHEPGLFQGPWASPRSC